MSKALPLADAAERLRASPPSSKFPRAVGRPRSVRSSSASPPTAHSQLRRLLDLPAAAEYLSLSTWSVRELVNVGVLPRVRVPLPNGGEIRRLLFDVTDLDALIAQWKDAAL